ncbi:MAG: hypothetical protein U0840_13500 [Gemmataceae bacterium]
MCKLLSGVLTLAVLVSNVAAADAPAPTIEDVIASPAKFEGMTLKFEKVEIHGWSAGPKRFRFTLKTPAGTTVKDTRKAVKGQRLVFVTGSKDEKAKEFVEKLKVGYYYTITITVEIKKEKDGFVAVVKDVGGLTYQAK